MHFMARAQARRPARRPSLQCRRRRQTRPGRLEGENLLYPSTLCEGSPPDYHTNFNPCPHTGATFTTQSDGFTPAFQSMPPYGGDHN